MIVSLVDDCCKSCYILIQGDRGIRGGFGLPGTKGMKGMKGGDGEKGMMGDEGLKGIRGRIGKNYQHFVALYISIRWDIQVTLGHLEWMELMEIRELRVTKA